MKIIFLLQSMNHPRYLRRINLMKELNIDYEVFSFERKDYLGSNENNFKSLGKVTNGNYFSRLKLIKKNIKIIKKNIQPSDVIYTFGLDTLKIGISAKSKFNSIIYEVGDIRKVFTSQNIKGKIFRFLEKKLIKKTNLLVVTSPAFITGYFKKILNIKKLNYHIIENKPNYNQYQLKEYYENQKTKLNLDKENIIIGYFGVLRCERTLQILVELAKKHPTKYQVILQGIINVNLIEKYDLNNKENIQLKGPYKVPDDLTSIYTDVDLVWAAYPYANSSIGNWKWAKTTRYYECLLLKKPLIVAKGTEDAKLVEKYNIGSVIDLNDINGSISNLEIILNNKMIKKYYENFSFVPESSYVYQNELYDLVEKIKKFNAR